MKIISEARVKNKANEISYLMNELAWRVVDDPYYLNYSSENKNECQKS